MAKRGRPKHSAYDYGTPEHATVVTYDAMVDAFEPFVEDGLLTLGNTGHVQVYLGNLAAGIVHDLITTGALTAPMPDPAKFADGGGE